MRKRKGVLLIAVALASISGSAAALAAAPELTRFSFQDEFVDTETCPTIPIATRVEGHISIQEFSDTLVQVHQRLIFTASANGKTYTDNESYTERIDPRTGIRRLTGTPVSIQIPHYGRLLADTGILTLDFSSDPPTVLHEGGPHPLFHDGFARLCEYLAS